MLGAYWPCQRVGLEWVLLYTEVSSIQGGGGGGRTRVCPIVHGGVLISEGWSRVCSTVHSGVLISEAGLEWAPLFIEVFPFQI